MSSFSVSRSFPMSRTRWGWLPLSVALNLVLIGIILGYASRSHEAAPRQALVTWQRELLPSLPPADVPVVSGATDRIAAAQAHGDTTVHQAYIQLRTILAASSLDKPGMETAFETIRSTRDAQQTTVDSIFFEELSNITPEGRAAVLKAMEAESRRLHPPGGH
jgi:hypothetical protein